MSETPYINGGVSFGRRSNAGLNGNAEIDPTNNLTAYNTPTYITP